MKSNHIGIVCCSNAQSKDYSNKIKQLENTLTNLGLIPRFSPFIYAKESVFSATAYERAGALMELYKDENIDNIFDISGGDIANGILPYLDYEIIANSSATFWGYSDLTTVINAIYTKTGKCSVLYQLRNLIYDHKNEQINNLKKWLFKNSDDLFKIDYEFVQGTNMKGVVIGGNIRCFLKLAGTEYMPDFTDSILLLESFGGTVAQMETYLCQLQQLGAFEKVSGILLGTFTAMENEKCRPTIDELLSRFVTKDMPIAKTRDIGHGTDSKAIKIGSYYEFSK